MLVIIHRIGGRTIFPEWRSANPDQAGFLRNPFCFEGVAEKVDLIEPLIYRVIKVLTGYVQKAPEGFPANLFQENRFSQLRKLSLMNKLAPDII